MGMVFEVHLEVIARVGVGGSFVRGLGVICTIWVRVLVGGLGFIGVGIKDMVGF